MAKRQSEVEAVAPDEAPSGYTGHGFVRSPTPGLQELRASVEAALAAGATYARWTLRLKTLPAEPRAEALAAARNPRRAGEPRANPDGRLRERRASGPWGLPRDLALVIDAEAAGGPPVVLALVCGACRAAFAGEPLAGHTHRLTAP